MRKVMVAMQCSRCQRTESLEYDAQKELDQKAAAPPAALVAALRAPDGTVSKVGFEDLCGPCYRSVKSLLEQIGKRIEGMSPDRPAKVKEPAVVIAKKKDPAPSPAPGPTAHAVVSKSARAG